MYSKQKQEKTTVVRKDCLAPMERLEQNISTQFFHGHTIFEYSKKIRCYFLK